MEQSSEAIALVLAKEDIERLLFLCVSAEAHAYGKGNRTSHWRYLADRLGDALDRARTASGESRRQTPESD